MKKLCRRYKRAHDTPLHSQLAHEKGEQEKKETAVQAHVTVCKSPTTLLKRHHKGQTASRNPMASGWRVQSQQKECVFAPFPQACRTYHTKLPIAVHLDWGLPQISHLHYFNML